MAKKGNLIYKKKSHTHKVCVCVRSHKRKGEEGVNPNHKKIQKLKVLWSKNRMHELSSSLIHVH
ncbi:hypothetical protein Hdeb2414_s0016g00483621 [Helianthus debilis subsp. tardiflorus]